MVCGEKPKFSEQLKPGRSENVGPHVESTEKFVPKLKVTNEPVSGWLPTFCNVTICGLSVLVLPTLVRAKFREGNCERLTSYTRVCPLSAMKTLPAASTAKPAGIYRPLVGTVVWRPLGETSSTTFRI